MVPVEIITATAAGVAALCTALFGGGLLKQAFANSNAHAVQKHMLEQTNLKVEKSDIAIQDLKVKVALIERDFEGLQKALAKLDMIPEIITKLSGVAQEVGYLREQITDFRTERNEHDHKS